MEAAIYLTDDIVNQSSTWNEWFEKETDHYFLGFNNNGKAYFYFKDDTGTAHSVWSTTVFTKNRWGYIDVGFTVIPYWYVASVIILVVLYWYVFKGD